jgi:hypothetical protein
MAKSKTYHSNAEGPITVAVPAQATTIRLEPGENYETDDPVVQESLEANSDVASGEAKSSESEDEGESRSRSGKGRSSRGRET